MLLRKEPARYDKGDVLSRRKIDVKPFDVETAFAEAALEKKSRARKYTGPESALHSAIYPLVCIMKVFGLAPYDFTADRMTPSNVYLVFSFVFVALYSCIMYFVFMRFIATKRQKPVLSIVETTKVVNKFNFALVIVNFLVAMFELISTTCTRNKFVRIWNSLQDYDERLSKLGYPRDERKIKIATWIILLSQTILWIVVNLSGMYAFSETWSFNVSYMCLYVATAISVYKFSGMVYFIEQRFRQLNEIARENMPPMVGYKSSKVSRKTIQDLHSELMSMSEALNSLYTSSLLFWLGNLGVHSVCNLYFIIDWIMHVSMSRIAWPEVFNMSSWLVSFFAQLLAIHVSCDRAVSEANSMGAILVEWDARVIRRFPNDDILCTSLQFLTRRPCFSAGGMFDVNLSLFCSLVGVMSTYLIILLQFPS